MSSGFSFLENIPFLMQMNGLYGRLPRFSRFQILVHLASLAPLAVMIVDYFRDNLTVNPIQELTFRTGKTALVLLILSLACTPLNTVFKFRRVLKVRRALGLYTFFYASLHFLTFIGLDYGFDLDLIREAIFEKRYALVGFSAFLILLAMALTSTKGWMRRLGKNWKRLHKLVYLAAGLVIVHYIWLVKSDIRDPLAYGFAVALLLVARIPAVRKFLSNFRAPRVALSNLSGKFSSRNKETRKRKSDPALSRSSGSAISQSES